MEVRLERAAEPRLREIIRGSGDLVREVFARVLVRCGAVPEKRARDSAAFLFTVLHGASALAATGGAAEVSGALDGAFASFDSKITKARKLRKR